jgi:hypothetical protein
LGAHSVRGFFPSIAPVAAAPTPRIDKLPGYKTKVPWSRRSISDSKARDFMRKLTTVVACNSKPNLTTYETKA